MVGYLAVVLAGLTVGSTVDPRVGSWALLKVERRVASMAGWRVVMKVDKMADN